MLPGVGQSNGLHVCAVRFVFFRELPCLLNPDDPCVVNLPRPLRSTLPTTTKRYWWHFFPFSTLSTSSLTGARCSDTCHLLITQWFQLPRFWSHGRFPLTLLAFALHDRPLGRWFLPKGAVGDCWFLAGLAVVSERADLIGRVVGSNDPLADELGCFEVNLFKDGRWERCGEAGDILVLSRLLEYLFALFSFEGLTIATWVLYFVYCGPNVETKSVGMTSRFGIH